jgi:hypothetical protein
MEAIWGAFSMREINANKVQLTRFVERGDRYGDDQSAAKRVRLLYRNLLASYGGGQNRALARSSFARAPKKTDLAGLLSCAIWSIGISKASR